MATSDYCPYDIQRDPKTVHLRRRSFPTRFGILNAVIGEQTSNTARVYLHGVGGTWASWSPLFQEMIARGQGTDNVLAFDLPGFGASENRFGSLPGVLVGEALVGAVHEAGWETVELIGHSMGGFLGIIMAGHMAEGSITSLQIVSGSYLSILRSVQKPLATLLHSPRAAAPFLGMQILSSLGPAGTGLVSFADRVGALRSVLSSTVAHPNLLKDSVVHSIASGMRPKSFVQAAKNGKGYDAETEWALVKVPFQAMFGSRDKLVPVSDADFLRQANPDVRVEVVADCGHFGPVERPREVLDLLEKFQV